MKKGVVKIFVCVLLMFLNQVNGAASDILKWDALPMRPLSLMSARLEVQERDTAQAGRSDI